MPFLQLIRSASVHPSNYVISDPNPTNFASEQESLISEKYRMDICWLVVTLVAVTLHLFLGLVVFDTLTNCKHCDKVFMQVVSIVGVFCAM